MKFFRLISLISTIVLIQYNVAQEDEQQELKLNILPADKYKISQKDYQILKNDIEFQVMNRLMELQHSYDERENLRNIAINQPMYSYPSINNKIYAPPIVPDISQVNIPITNQISEQRTYYNDFKPTELKYSKGYTFHISEKELKDLLNLKKDLQDKVDKEKAKQNENNKALGNDLVLSPSLTEDGENIVINTKTKEIGTIQKLKFDEKQDEEEDDEDDEDETNKNIKQNKLIEINQKAVNESLGMHFPTFKQTDDNEKIIQKIYNKTKEKISNLKYEEVKSELSNKSIQELELIYKMLPLPLINNEIIYKNKKTKENLR